MNLYNVIEQMENSNVGKIVGKENAIQPNITSKKISLHKVEYIQPSIHPIQPLPKFKQINPHTIGKITHKKMSFSKKNNIWWWIFGTTALFTVTYIIIKAYYQTKIKLKSKLDEDKNFFQEGEFNL